MILRSKIMESENYILGESIAKKLLDENKTRKEIIRHIQDTYTNKYARNEIKCGASNCIKKYYLSKVQSNRNDTSIITFQGESIIKEWLME
jgi:hypothetical protein